MGLHYLIICSLCEFCSPVKPRQLLLKETRQEEAQSLICNFFRFSFISALLVRPESRVDSIPLQWRTQTYSSMSNSDCYWDLSPETVQSVSKCLLWKLLSNHFSKFGFQIRVDTPATYRMVGGMSKFPKLSHF